MAEETSKDILLAQVRECFGKVAWSHKTQECQASIYNNYHKRLIWAKILVAGLAAGSGIISLFSGVAIRYATAILSSLVLIIDLTFKNHAYADKSAQHQAVATKLWRIREAYQTLIAELMSEQCNLSDIRKRIEQLADRLEKVYEIAPRTSDSAYKAASNKLHSGSCSCSDDEIDKLLPPRLRSVHD